MSKIIRFNYLYRDEANYKEWGSFDFTNPDGLAVEEIERIPRQNFEQDELFIAHQVGIPEIFFYSTDPITEDDHCYHEFASVEAIETAETEPPSRSISEFLNAVQSAASAGWKAFDPADRLPELRLNIISPEKPINAMNTIVRFEAVRGHIIVPISTGNALIDTGSPTSFAAAPFEFAGRRHAPPTGMMGVTTETISELADIRIDALVGCDILNGFGAMRIRWNDGVMEFSDRFADDKATDMMDNLAGIPVFPVRLGEISTKAIFDTGAHLSHIDPELVSSMTPISHKDDFNPINGKFTAPVFSVSTTIADRTYDIEYGILPGTLGLMTSMTMRMTSSSAVIGTAILEHFDVTISWHDGTISWTPTK